MQKSPQRTYGLISIVVILIVTFIGKDPFTDWLNSMGITNSGVVLFFWLLGIVVLVGIAEFIIYHYWPKK